MNKYEKQGADFLLKFGLKFSARFIDNSCPPFCEGGKHIHGCKYQITILRERDKTNVRFPFWNSYNDAMEDKGPTPYDVLACLSGEINCPESFEGFCGELGYDTDSRKAEKTFKLVKKQCDKLHAFFTEEEIEELQLIN